MITTPKGDEATGADGKTVIAVVSNTGYKDGAVQSAGRNRDKF
jgi:hypothetical protein